MSSGGDMYGSRAGNILTFAAVKELTGKSALMKKILILLVLSVLATAFFGCEQEARKARIEVWLTDAPGDFEEVNVDVQGVEVHTAEGETESGWVSLQVEQGVYNILELTNGLDTLLGTLELPAGRISQLRLKLGSENTLKIKGQTYNLSTPSGQQSGLKLQINEVLREGITYKVLLDFDAARSIVERGNGTYSLKPVIRTITRAQDGAIRGSVNPLEATPAVYAILGQDTISTAFTNPEGNFLLRGLRPGTYKVAFSPAEGYLPTERTNISVTTGNVTNIGETVIAQN